MVEILKNVGTQHVFSTMNVKLPPTEQELGGNPENTAYVYSNPAVKKLIAQLNVRMINQTAYLVLTVC